MASKLQRILAFAVVLLLSLPYGALPASATCGGGGGGGRGGAMGGGSSAAAEVYHVSWKILPPGEPTPDGSLILYWFPTSEADAQKSDLLSSRYLTLSSGQCVTMALVTDSNKALRTKYAAVPEAPSAVLTAKDGSELGRVHAEKGKLYVDEVEELLRAEIVKREDAAKKLLDTAKEKAGQNDVDGAATIYTQLWEQRCLLPSQAKKAAKALKKLGKPVPEEETSALIDAPNLSEPVNTEMVRTMTAALTAERDGKVLDAKRLYIAARKMDPADPVPARFLGEIMRHETGEWAEARTVFNEILTRMHADPLSRAVALHGLGKMTIHDGGFKQGLELFDASIRTYPLALTYRNLAVYWNSEKNSVKAYEYVKKAMDLDPDDLYNQIFAATYLVKLGRPQEAEEIARHNEDLVAASYNLAAIHAQLGNKDKALEMLRRHFYVYEKFDAVRAKEMQEARDDIAFAAYHHDPDFVKLTAMAETDGSSYHRKGA